MGDDDATDFANVDGTLPGDQIKASRKVGRGGFEENESTNLFSMLPTPLGASIGVLLVERFVLIRAVSGSLVGDFLFYWDSILELVLSVCMCVCVGCCT